MKRMNLLPPELRVREGDRRGSSYVVVGALVASVLAMLLFAVVISGARSDESELASLKDEAQQAQAQADALAPYGEFANMKEHREQSIRTVADTRFNYERLTRELAQILPGGVWVGHVEVAPAPPEQTVVEAGADSSDGSQESPPAMKVSGCAPSQDVVADALDRLRALTGATNVALGSSSNSGSSAPTSGKSYLVSGPAAGGGCGESGRPSVAFDATVTLTTPGGEQLPAPTTTQTGAGS
jgi:Tfp pilus assembly protein PilN